MIYIVNNSNKPDYNVALEEYCFKKLKHYDKIFILWINEPSIIVGKHQNVFEEVNIEYVKKKGIQVIRRISGGGAVYHDRNNLNYTFIANKEDGRDFDFKAFSKPVIETLARLGVKAESTKRNDIVINGKKICGHAQAYIKGRIMHHGCLLFDADLSVLSKALEEPKDKITSNSTKSVRSVVDNIRHHLSDKISVNEFSEKLLEQVKRTFPEIEAYHFTNVDLAEIEALRTSKYSMWEWNYGHSPKFDIERNTQFDAGTVQVTANIANFVIQKINFSGTFFEKNNEISEVESILVGVKYTPEAVKKSLTETNYNRYFTSLTLDEITKTIVD